MAALGSERIGATPHVVAPLRIAAHLDGGIVMREPLALDALLMLVYARRAQLRPPASPTEIVPIDIPVAQQDGVYLCSFALATVEQNELRHKQRRPPVQEFAKLGTSKIKRVDISVGANKMYRVPYVLGHLHDDELTWFAMGDAEMIRGLLADIRYLGKHTGSGKGKLRGVDPWEVTECELWGEGFPVVRDSKPLRNLPTDWPGLTDPETAFRCLTPPYWMRENEVLCAVP